MSTSTPPVNTLVIGAGRSGTTSLCSYLAGHASVCFSNLKEVHYFSIPDLYWRGTGYYASFFENFNGEPVIASADTYLLMDHDAIARIRDYNPEMKIIALLRDPVDRAFSSYNYSVNFGHHPPYETFLESLDHEKNIADEVDIVKRNNLGHFYGSKYFFHLEKWIKTFGKNQVLILRIVDMNDPGSGFFKRLCNFLDIPVSSNKMGTENKGAAARSKRFEQFLLNRDVGLRKVLRAAVPEKVKRLIFKSGIVDSLHNLNRKDGVRQKLTADEYDAAFTYFREDLTELKNQLGIAMEKRSFED